MDDPRRSHARFPSDLKVEVFSGPVGGVRIGEGLLIDLSLTGCLLRVGATLRQGATYRLSCKWREGVLDLPGRVARDAGRSGSDPLARHYGLAFNLTYDQEKSLMRLIEVVRRSEQAGGGGFMSNYW